MRDRNTFATVALSLSVLVVVACGDDANAPGSSAPNGDTTGAPSDGGVAPGDGGALAPEENELNDDTSLVMPAVGSTDLRVLAPTMLELTLVTTKDPDPAKAKEWSFVDGSGNVALPPASALTVTAGGKPIAIKRLGYRRRVMYARLWPRDLRIGNHLYVELGDAIADGASVEVTNPDGSLFSSAKRFARVADAQRYSPAIHVNQVGYAPPLQKRAYVGYFLGSLGEMSVAATTFRIVTAEKGNTVYSGKLTPRAETGFTYSAYQNVLQADFSDFATPGKYRLVVPGLGSSFPFFVDDGVPAAFARTYAKGLYHQRCGTSNDLPETRFTHKQCHIAPAAIPTSDPLYDGSWQRIASNSGGDEAQTAPQVTSPQTMLYPFVRQGTVDVHKGHHDAGDYSKYVTNSAALIDTLVFAVDAFPGAVDLDNLGIPESGDGMSDLLQEAKWESDFLVNMQDDDGGFYTLVYPRDRAYEADNVPGEAKNEPEPQIVWPKSTVTTGAAVGALAKIASSPAFKKQWPTDAARYLAAAKKGYDFLFGPNGAIAKYGMTGAYQRVYQYGSTFAHDDELAWAAVEMFLATGDSSYHDKFKSLMPSDFAQTRRWGWWRLFEGYGAAIRDYAFGARTGRVASAQLDPTLLSKCEDEIRADGSDQLRYVDEDAYGNGLPDVTKHYRAAGWNFSADQAFGLAVAFALDGDSKKIDAIVSNVNFEAGANPVNVVFVEGLGWKRQRQIVSQYADNARHTFPPTGIEVASVEATFMSWGLAAYPNNELNELSFPTDDATFSPFYDRWGDTFNVATESVSLNEAHSLASLALLMARSPLKDQKWKTTPITIALPAQAHANQPLTANVQLPAGLDLRDSRFVWEAGGQEPSVERSFTFTPANAGDQWVEVEVQWPDGRRVFGAASIAVSP